MSATTRTTLYKEAQHLNEECFTKLLMELGIAKNKQPTGFIGVDSAFLMTLHQESRA